MAVVRGEPFCGEENLEKMAKKRLGNTSSRPAS